MSVPQPSDDDRLAQLEQPILDLDRQVENNRLVRDAWTLVIFTIAVFRAGWAMLAATEISLACSVMPGREYLRGKPTPRGNHGRRRDGLEGAQNACGEAANRNLRRMRGRP